MINGFQSVSKKLNQLQMHLQQIAVQNNDITTLFLTQHLAKDLITDLETLTIAATSMLVVAQRRDHSNNSSVSHMRFDWNQNLWVGQIGKHKVYVHPEVFISNKHFTDLYDVSSWYQLAHGNNIWIEVPDFPTQKLCLADFFHLNIPYAVGDPLGYIITIRDDHLNNYDTDLLCPLCAERYKGLLAIYAEPLNQIDVQNNQNKWQCAECRQFIRNSTL